MASNNIHTQFILRQQEYINVQQQYLEKLLLNNDQDQKLLRLEEEFKLLKLKFQCLNANTNKQHAYFVTQMKLLKKENANLNHKMEKLIVENCIIDQIEDESLNQRFLTFFGPFPTLEDSANLFPNQNVNLILNIQNRMHCIRLIFVTLGII